MSLHSAAPEGGPASLLVVAVALLRLLLAPGIPAFIRRLGATRDFGYRSLVGSAANEPSAA
jgi:hypothetical protein